MVKRVLVVALFIGLVIGFGIGYVVAPQGVDITELEQRVSDLEGQINGKNNQIATLQSQLSEKDELISEQQSQLTQKDNQIQGLQEQISDLNQSYQELQEDYEKLLNDYKMLNAPVSNFTSVGDLDFTIATHQRIYSYNDPISGNTTIYYHNGTAFKGTFSIYIEQLGGPMGSGWTFYVDGRGEFYKGSPAFLYGPGTYQIGLSVLYDSEGYMIATSNEIGHIYVTVEAK